MLLPVPAIDLLGGKCVRLMQGQYHQVTTYHDDPVWMAQYWHEQGAQLLHIVDLDAAKSGGTINNINLIATISKSVNIPVQTGGGIRTLEDIERVLSCGIHRAILGTAAVRNPDLVTAAVAQFGPEHIAIGIDAQNNEVRIHGWTKGGGLEAIAMAKAMERRGVRRIIYTDISRDGTMQGPNINAYQAMGAALTQCLITASGGISDYQDLDALMPLTSIGVDSVIIGRALYEKSIEAHTLWH